MRFFAQVMQEALYGDKGYYRTLRVGKEGDFYTSVSVGELFGFTIGFHIARTHKEYGFPLSVVEIGAEKGYLIGDIVRYCLKYEVDLLSSLQFYILEPLPELRFLQEQYFKEQGILEYIHIIDPSCLYSFKTPLFIANELFDAIPCDLIYQDKIAVMNDSVLEFVSPNQSHDEVYAKAVLDIAQKYHLQRGEISLQMSLVLEKLLKDQENWGFLTFDYGEDYFRDDFSIRFFKEHQLFCLDDFKQDPMSFIGVADMTYDVAFNYLDVLFEQYHAKRYGFFRQNKALMCLGLAQVFDLMTQGMDVTSTQYIRLGSMLKTLITPSLLGDRFKCVFYASEESWKKFMKFSF